MIIKVERNMQFSKYYYKLSTEKEIWGTANYTCGLKPRKIVVSSESAILELKQTNWILKLINSLPLLNSETFTPFKYYVNGTCCGSSKKVRFKPVFQFVLGKEMFELRQHNNNYISLKKGSLQIALFQKKEYSLYEKNCYEIKYDNKRITSSALLLLFCIFIDVNFYNNSMRISYLKSEKNYVYNDTDKACVNWEPDES